MGAGSNKLLLLNLGRLIGLRYLLVRFRYTVVSNDAHDSVIEYVVCCCSRFWRIYIYIYPERNFSFYLIGKLTEVIHIYHEASINVVIG